MLPAARVIEIIAGEQRTAIIKHAIDQSVGYERKHLILSDIGIEVAHMIRKGCWHATYLCCGRIRIALKSLTFVPVGPVTNRSFSIEKTE